MKKKDYQSIVGVNNKVSKFIICMKKKLLGQGQLHFFMKSFFQIFFVLCLFLFVSSCESLKTRDQLKKSKETSSTEKGSDHTKTSSNQDSGTGSDSRNSLDSSNSSGFESKGSAGGSTIGSELFLPPALNSSEEKPAITTDHSSSPSSGGGSGLGLSEKPRIAIILGPGSLRSFAHIGVIQELIKARLNIHSVGGLEMGALIAALYANKGQAFDVEWQMFKMKEEDLFKKNFLSSSNKAGDPKNLYPFVQKIFGAAKVEDFKLPFLCPSYNLKKGQVYLMNRGPLMNMLPYCLSSYPLLKPYQENIAGFSGLSQMVRSLRAKGANYVIYVDLLDGKDSYVQELESEANVTWMIIEEYIKSQLQTLGGEVNYIVKVPLSTFSINDFNKRREMLQRGHEAGKMAAQQIMKQFGL